MCIVTPSNRLNNTCHQSVKLMKFNCHIQWVIMGSARCCNIFISMFLKNSQMCFIFSVFLNIFHSKCSAQGPMTEISQVNKTSTINLPSCKWIFAQLNWQCSVNAHLTSKHSSAPQHGDYLFISRGGSCVESETTYLVLVKSICSGKIKTGFFVGRGT